MRQADYGIKFGVMCRSHTLAAWQIQCIQRAVDIAGVELVLCIIKSPFDSKNSSFNQSTDFQPRQENNFLWDFVQRRLCSKIPALLLPASLKSIIGNNPVLRCKDNHVDGLWEFEDMDIADIRSHNLDFIISFDQGRPEGEILEATKRGIWYFQLGVDRFQSGPPGFWEIFYNCFTTSTYLKQSFADMENDIILKQGQFKTISGSYSANLGQLLYESSRWLAQACVDLQNGTISSLKSSQSSSSEIEVSVPSKMQCIGFYLKLKKNKIQNLFNKLFIHRHWGLAISFSRIEKFLDQSVSPQIAFLPKPSRDFFHADPFGMIFDDQLAILHEQCTNVQGLGKISCFLVDRDALDKIRNDLLKDQINAVSACPVSVNIEFPCHSSYPYLLNYGSKYYCIPETGQAGRVSLYQCNGHPSDWTHLVDIITDFQVIDSSIVQFEDKWWLFCTRFDDNPDTNLYLWFADNLTGPWEPHLNNPVKADITSARPAGTPFLHNGALYRPTQDSSRNYGASISIQKITELSPTTFSEHYSTDLKQFSKIINVDGMHTISQVGDFTLHDYYHHKFLPGIFIYRLKLYINSKRKR